MYQPQQEDKQKSTPTAPGGRQTPPRRSADERKAEQPKPGQAGDLDRDSDGGQI